MPQTDYILRMIEQIGAILSELRNLILGRTADRSGIDRRLRGALLQVGFDVDLVRIADAESLQQMVTPGGEVEPTRCWVTAETLYLDGLEARLDGRADDAARAWHKALLLYRLFRASRLTSGGFPEVDARIAEIEQGVEGG